MPRKPVDFMGKTYKSQTDFEKYVKHLIYEVIGPCDDIKTKHSDKYEILIKLLERHPEFELKTENMTNLKIMRDALNRRAYKIMIVKNCEEVDISWKCAITAKGKPKKELLMSAMRVSVQDQIYEFKRNCTNRYCEICNSEELLQVDHNDQINSAFDELAYNFVNESKMEIPETFDELNDNTHRCCFSEKDRAFKDKWAEYHRQNAKLRILCRICNISRPKTKIKLVFK